VPESRSPVTGRDRIRYRGGHPLPLGMPATAERLAVVEGMAALGRELTADEARVAVACAHLFSGQLIDLESQVAELMDKILDAQRGTG
jgi:hypothetical protein